MTSSIYSVVGENLFAQTSSSYFFKNNEPIPVSFCLFRFFLDIISVIQIEKGIDGVLGIRTWGRWVVSADETTELGIAPVRYLILICAQIVVFLRAIASSRIVTYVAKRVS